MTQAPDLQQMVERRKALCTHTNSYWAGIVRTCPLCLASYDRTLKEQSNASE